MIPEQEDVVAACLPCRLTRGELPAPGGVMYQDSLWQPQHDIEPVSLVGWLVLKPLRHVEAFADLTDDEAADHAGDEGGAAPGKD